MLDKTTDTIKRLNFENEMLCNADKSTVTTNA